MKTGLWRRLVRFSRSLTPLLLTLAVVLASVLPLRIPHFAVVMPLLSMMAVFYWSIYRPELLPAAAVFALGVVQDALGGGPLGLSALVLLLVHGVGVSQRRFFLGKSFAVEWWGFILVASGAALVGWLLASLYYTAWIDPGAVLAQALLTMALYPCFSWLFARSARIFLRPV